MSFPRYPKYKDSGVEWLGQVPEHWEVDRFKTSVQTCRNGIWGGEAQENEDDVPCVRVADFNRQRLRVVLHNPTIRNVTASERDGRLLSRGDLLLEKSGGGELQPVGCVVLYEDNSEAICSNFVARMQLAEGMVPSFWRYLHAAAYTVRLNTRSIKQTSGIQNLDQQQYLDERAAFPPSVEQSAIATFLDRETAKIDALIAEQQRLIELLQEKRQAVISHAVTKGLNPDAPMKDSGIEWLGEVPEHWGVTKVKFVTAMTADCPHETPEYSDDGEYLVIRTADVTEGRLNESQMYRVSEAQYQRRVRRASLDAGDVVYTREGERWGLAATVPTSDRFCLGQRMFQLRAHEEFCGQFLMWHLSARCVYAQAEVDTIGATAPHVNLSSIINFAIVNPPLHEQHDVSKFLETTTGQMDGLVATAERTITLLQERRSTLISAAVTGQIDVRNYASEGAAA